MFRSKHFCTLLQGIVFMLMNSLGTALLYRSSSVQRNLRQRIFSQVFEVAKIFLHYLLLVHLNFLEVWSRFQKDSENDRDVSSKRHSGSILKSYYSLANSSDFLWSFGFSNWLMRQIPNILTFKFAFLMQGDVIFWWNFIHWIIVLQF